MMRWMAGVMLGLVVVGSSSLGGAKKPPAIELENVSLRLTDNPLGEGQFLTVEFDATFNKKPPKDYMLHGVALTLTPRGASALS
jgi:hypothetical protein